MSKVLTATLHDSMHQPGLGTIGPKLSHEGDALFKPVDMALSADGLTLLVTTRKTPNLPSITISVPIHNVKYYVAE